jgi:hypothetical protein
MKPTMYLDDVTDPSRQIVTTLQGDAIELVILDPVMPGLSKSSQRTADDNLPAIEVLLGSSKRREAGLLSIATAAASDQ